LPTPYLPPARPLALAQLRRWPLRNNHTGTHILNFCLREVLGDHIDQKGSLVAPTKLRFDFSHKAPISVKDLATIEDQCNDWIKRNVKVFSKEMDLATAQKIPGLRAVFGEAYPDPVRVVTLAYSLDEITADLDNPKWRSTSVEFCGGTHVAKTGDIKDFVVVEESGIAKGIRRIIAITGEDARRASQLANESDARFERVSKLAAGADKEHELKQLELDLAAQAISVVRKDKLRTQVTSARKAIADAARAQDKEQAKAVADAVTDFFKANADAQVFVARFDDAKGNAKVRTPFPSLSLSFVCVRRARADAPSSLSPARRSSRAASTRPRRSTRRRTSSRSRPTARSRTSTRSPRPTLSPAPSRQRRGSPT